MVTQQVCYSILAKFLSDSCRVHQLLFKLFKNVLLHHKIRRRWHDDQETPNLSTSYYFGIKNKHIFFSTPERHVVQKREYKYNWQLTGGNLQRENVRASSDEASRHWFLPQSPQLRAWHQPWSSHGDYTLDKHDSLTCACCDIQMECECSQLAQLRPPLKGNSEVRPWFVSESDQVLIFRLCCFIAALLIAFLMSRCWRMRAELLFGACFILHDVAFWSPKQQVKERPRVAEMSVSAECTRNDWQLVGHASSIWLVACPRLPWFLPNTIR